MATMAKEGQIARNPETGERFRVENGKWVPVAEDSGPSRAMAAAGGAASGFTLGFDDEIAGLVGAIPAALQADVTLAEAYRGVRDAARATAAEQQQAFPWTYGGAEVLGGAVLPGGAVAKGAQAASRFGRPAGRLALGGAGVGGAAGAGYSDASSAVGVTQDALVGSLIGGVATPVVGFAGEKAVEGITGLGAGIARRMFSSDAPAMNTVRRAIDADGYTSPDQLLGALAEIGPDAVMADAGENLRGLASLSARTPGAGRSQAVETVNARQAGQQERLDSAARDTISPAWDDYWRFTDDLIARRKAGAEDLYERAYRNTIMPSEVLVDFSKTPLGQEVLQEAQRRIGNSFNARGASDLGAGEAGMSTRLWQEAVRVLKDRAGTAYREGKSGLGTDMSEWMKAIRADIHSQNPDLKAANSFFAGSKELQEAAEIGREAMSGNKTFAGDVERMMQGMTDGELEAFKVGLFRGVQDRIEAVSTRGDASRRLDQSERLVGVMREAFGSPEKFDEFWRVVQGEMEMAATRNRVRPEGNSITSGVLLEDRGAGSELVDDMTRGGMLEAFMQGVRRITSPKLEPEDHARIVEMLFGDLSEDTLRRIFSTRAGDIVPSGTGAVIGVPAGAAGVRQEQELGVLRPGG